ncbi:MAG: DNA replication/repair protein RecF [Ruminococcaceae bacterium]|nr:DNA replication/repair protein RecF [Oscillospiraceae bacterium]
MIINSLCVTDYRNIDFIKINPSENVNIIFGENAQGKTNLLESIWLFTGCKSFKTKKDSELLGFNKDFSKNRIEYSAFGREQNIEMVIDTKRKITKNGIELKSSAELIGSFYAVIFSPMHLSLIQDGPVNRRAFLDTALCQLKPNYAKGLARYRHTLEQRNALLKDIQFHSELYDTLDIWDEKLSSYGAAVVYERIKYAEILSEHANKIYFGISDGKEELKVNYINNTGLYIKDPYEIKNFLKERLRQTRRDDIFNKITGIGPQRDDLDITINDLSVRKFGSQGQKRSCALALKLSEANIIKDITGEEPVILLDDVMSELDLKRQDYILNHINGRQVFITCCDPVTILRMCEGKTFHIDKGHLI